MSIKITATANGSLVPPTATFPNAVQNGDFHGDPAYPFFSTAQGLTSAILTLTLTPKDQLITTDLVRIDVAGFGNITNPIQVLPVNVTNTIQIDLLAQPTYTAAAILSALSTGLGKVPMV